MSALAEICEAPGLDAYLLELEDRLERAVAAYRGVVADVGAEALAAGGKRLRPLLVYLSTPPDAEPPVIAGVSVELVHLATLMHDDLIDGARLRRGHASAWSAHGTEAARTAGDYLFARAFAELSATGDARAVAILAARRDEAVRAALAGGLQLEGALLRVASTGAIEESREVALAYARSARACLNGELHREELESLTYAVVDRER